MAIVAGSGLSALGEAVHGAVRLPYGELPGWPVSTVVGHDGQLVLGTMAGRHVALAAGRAHMYEGYSAREATFGVRVQQALGARTLVVTNASGGLNDAYEPGDLMVIIDHIFLPGLVGNSPLVGPNDEAIGRRFPSIRGAYDGTLSEVAADAARAAGFNVHLGVYAMVGGPSYETPAEGRLLRALGADVVGMSTAPEVVVGRHAGMRVIGLSLVTNRVDLSAQGADRADPAASAADSSLHAEVTAVGGQQARRLATCVEDIVRRS